MDPVRCTLDGIPQNLPAVVVLCAFALLFFVLAFNVGKGILKLNFLKDTFGIDVPVENQQKFGKWIFAAAGGVLFLLGIIGVPWASGPCSRPPVTSSQATATALAQAQMTATTAAQAPLGSGKNISEGRSQACFGSGKPLFDFEAQSMSCFGTPDIAWNQQGPRVDVFQGNVRLATIPSSDVSAGWDSITLDKLRSYDYSQTSLRLNAGQMFAVLTHSGHHVKVQVTGIGGLIDPGFSGLTYTFTYAMYR